MLASHKKSVSLVFICAVVFSFLCFIIFFSTLKYPLLLNFWEVFILFTYIFFYLVCFSFIQKDLDTFHKRFSLSLSLVSYNIRLTNLQTFLYTKKIFIQILMLKNWFKTFYCIIIIDILCSLHNSHDYDFYESFENHLKFTEKSPKNYFKVKYNITSKIIFLELFQGMILFFFQNMFEYSFSEYIRINYWRHQNYTTNILR